MHRGSAVVKRGLRCDMYRSVILALDRRLVVVGGKGGVGKSTVVAALALCGARAGKKVLCCEVNTKERVAPLLGARPSGPVIQEAVLDVFTVNVTPREAMREYALMKLRFESVYKAVFENKLVRTFLRLVPSLAETVMLGKVLYEVERLEGGGHKWDMVILDAPATGHGVSLLRVPRVLLETVPPGPMRDDAARMQATLRDPRVTRVDLVTLPEEMPVNETLELAGAVREDLGLSLGNLYLNGWVDQRFSPAEIAAMREVAGPDATQCPSSVDPCRAAARAGLYHASRAERSELYERRLTEELAPLPMIRLPFVNSKEWGRAQLDRLADVMCEASGRAAGREETAP